MGFGVTTRQNFAAAGDRTRVTSIVFNWFRGLFWVFLDFGVTTSGNAIIDFLNYEVFSTTKDQLRIESEKRSSPAVGCKDGNQLAVFVIRFQIQITIFR